MITIFMSFLLAFIPFAVLHCLKSAAWVYYIPSSLIVALLWLRVIFSRYARIGRALVNKHPDIFQDEVAKDMFLASPSLFLPSLELITAFTRWDFSSTIGYAFLISLVYSIISIVRADWIALALCVMIVIDSIYGNMRDAFETGNQDQDTLRVVHRYVKSKKMKIKGMSDIESMQLSKKYVQIRDSLALYKKAT